jgi:hypothetical protein
MTLSSGQYLDRYGVVREAEPHNKFGKWMIAEAAFIKYAAEQGWQIYKGFTGTERCDYAIDADGERLLVEVKYCGPGTSILLKRRPFVFDRLFVHTEQSGDYWLTAADIELTSGGATNFQIQQSTRTGPHLRTPSKWARYRI